MQPERNGEGTGEHVSETEEKAEENEIEGAQSGGRRIAGVEKAKEEGGDDPGQEQGTASPQEPIQPFCDVAKQIAAKEKLLEEAEGNITADLGEEGDGQRHPHGRVEGVDDGDPAAEPEDEKSAPDGDGAEDDAEGHIPPPATLGGESEVGELPAVDEARHEPQGRVDQHQGEDPFSQTVHQLVMGQVGELVAQGKGAGEEGKGEQYPPQGRSAPLFPIPDQREESRHLAAFDVVRFAS